MNKCLNCKGDLVERRRTKRDMSGVAYLYQHCILCGKDFDSVGLEIVHEGDTYSLKRDKNE